jgi:conjugal transfer ATP-binding protein TraC
MSAGLPKHERFLRVVQMAIDPQYNPVQGAPVPPPQPQPNPGVPVPAPVTQGFAPPVAPAQGETYIQEARLNELRQKYAQYTQPTQIPSTQQVPPQQQIPQLVQQQAQPTQQYNQPPVQQRPQVMPQPMQPQQATPIQPPVQQYQQPQVQQQAQPAPQQYQQPMQAAPQVLRQQGAQMPTAPVMPQQQFTSGPQGQQPVAMHDGHPVLPSPSNLPSQNQFPDFRQYRGQVYQNPGQAAPNELDRLRKLDNEKLRKEFIQTQIETEKQYIEVQKEYQKGVNTIKDLISPSAVKISSGKLELGTKYIRTHFVLTYPRIINTGWLESAINADIPLDVSIFIYPQDSETVLKELRKKVGKIQASLSINNERGAARDPALETAYQDVEQLRDAIQQGVEKFYRVGVYVTVYADDEEQLERYSKTIENFFARQNIIAKRAALQMDDGFNASLPILKDDLNVFNNLNTSPLSAAFPFVSSDLSSDNGILYGINRHNTSLVIFDRFELENANSTIFATSGAGKSYTVKLEILRSLMMGTSVIVIDPENEYKTLADTVGGTYINLSLNSENRINPFDLPKALAGESAVDVLRTAITDLLGLISLMVGSLTPEEASVMERAIKETYAKYDITETSDNTNKIIPTLTDLVSILKGITGGDNLAQRLYRYVEGTFSGLMNQRTNINVNNEFIVFNIRDLQTELRPIAMYSLLKYVWSEIRSVKKKRILAVDEAWIMMQNEDSARFLFGLVKRARKYYLGVTTITQDVGDFLRSPFGKPIVTNSAMKILLKQDSAAIENIKEIFNLTDGEAQVLLQSSVGQGIFFAGPRHVAIEIIAFPTEHKIITSNPRETA